MFIAHDSSQISSLNIQHRKKSEPGAVATG